MIMITSFARDQYVTFPLLNWLKTKYKFSPAFGKASPTLIYIFLSDNTELPSDLILVLAQYLLYWMQGSSHVSQEVSDCEQRKQKFSFVQIAVVVQFANVLFVV
jgi:hypothetical protein